MTTRVASFLLPVACVCSLLSACSSKDSNAPPTLGTTAVTTNEDVALNSTLVASDPENDALTFAITTQPAHGTATLTAAGALSYTPTANYNGADSIGVSVSDDAGGTTAGTVTVTVSAVNDSPAFTSPTINTDEEVALNLNVATYASDVDGNTLTFAVNTAPSHGTLTLTAAGAAVYTPTANYNGADNIGVSVSDGAGGTTVGTVMITVSAVNDAPTFTSPTFNTDEEVALNLNVATYASDIEGNTLTFAVNTAPSHGTLTLTTAGAAVYTPAANYNGADSISVSVSDGAGGTTVGTVMVTVSAVNDAPVFIPSAINTDEDVTLNTNVASYASDVDGNTLTFAVNMAPSHGTLTLTAAGAVLYTPAANYHGPDSFSVHISDGAGGELDGTVSINVIAVNDLPILVTNQLSVAEDGVLTAQLAATDVENQPIQYDVVAGAGHGQVSISASGLLSYTPVPDYFGADEIMVGVTDGVAAASWPLTLTVNAVNDGPVAFEDLLRLPANASVVLPILTNDSDVDDDNLTVTILSQPGGGTLSVSPTNAVTFTRDNEFNGPIRFRYRVTDSGGLWAEADVRAVIGEFPGLYYLSDETTVGRPEVHWFDGLRVYRMGIDLDPGEVISSFSMAGDGQTVAYVAESATVARVFFTGPSASDSRVIFTSGPKPVGTPLHPSIRLNRNGTYLSVGDPFAANGSASYMVRTSDGLQTRIGANTPQIVQGGSYRALSPANDDFYVQMQVGGQPPPMSGTGYLTLFRGNSASAADLTQVGLVYPTPSNGGGSGMEVEVTADGRYVIHEEILYSPTRSSVLVYDSVSGIEAPVYRRPVTGEIGNWNGFALSNDGSRVCFLFRQPGGGSFGPSTFVAGDPGAPASAGPVTPVVAGGYKCKFGSDNHTMFYLANTVAEPREQMYAVDAAAPGTPVVINRPFVAGETLEDWWVARDAMRLVFGVRGISPQVSWYSVSLASPGTFIPFATNVFDDGSLPGQLDASGYVLAYSRRPQPLSGLRRLTLLSTQTANYNLSLTRADTSTGLLQFEWAPRP